MLLLVAVTVTLPLVEDKETVDDIDTLVDAVDSVDWLLLSDSVIEVCPEDVGLRRDNDKVRESRVNVCEVDDDSLVVIDPEMVCVTDRLCESTEYERSFVVDDVKVDEGTDSDSPCVALWVTEGLGDGDTEGESERLA